MYARARALSLSASHTHTHSPTSKGSWGASFKGKTVDKVCSFWFHTSFVHGNELVLLKAELDGPPKKDKKNEKFRETFGVAIACTDADTPVLCILEYT